VNFVVKLFVNLDVNLDADGLAAALAALGGPIAQGLRQACGRDAKAGFEFALCDGQRVVKFGGAGKVAHAEAIEPLERTRATFLASNDLHDKLLGEHAGNSVVQTIAWNALTLFHAVDSQIAELE
jgi:hypothetical protein